MCSNNRQVLLFKLKMIRTSKTKNTLADKIANILVAAPQNEDPEDETDGTKAQLDEHVEETNSDEEELLSKFRKQNIELLADVDERYAGKKSSRKELAGSDEASDDELEDTVIHSESSEPQDEEDNDESDDQQTGESNASQSEDEDNLSGESDASDNNFMPMKETDASAQVTKGLSVRNQLSIWENLLEMRIQLQKCLISANKMPQSQNYKQMKKESDVFTNKVGETKNSLCNVLDKLLLFQQIVLKNYPETKNLAELEGDAKTENSDDEEIPSDSENHENHDQSEDIATEPQVKKRKLINYESEIDARHNKYRKYRNEVIQKWHDKTRIAAIKSNAPQHSIISHIEHTLSDKAKLIKHTQLKRSDYKILGVESKKELEENAEEEVQQIDEYNTEIFDDDDFYHQMLRELIEMKSADVTDPVQLGRQWIQLQNLRSKMKRKVDTRASKGRKIRYAIHSKLVNFMAPIDENLWTDEAKSELYSSLFGKNQSVISV
ncbi:unnamed protein product [Callosobruchus maculatus]|uniref:Protein AATF n=1 Tax=Callosobruchus maculatus TaxID=64391 RepID=A0A653BXW6_CALMS|nr:unnamed protein product [Callosobruchus maculatus]